MPNIVVLDKSIYELIAAGEVIEKPASVIKEAVENSIDAGAKHITVEIRQGGISFMRISDDGCGMAQSDVPTAFLRHATSKISTKDDLQNINTLGFRGEALASVAAVAKVTVVTKRSIDVLGTCYKINGSVEESIENIGCQNGTVLTVRDLFYNVPARRKFLKKEVTEGNAISFIIKKVTLTHPEISFKFIRDGRTEFFSSGDGNLKSAIYSVYGKDFANDMIPVNYEHDNIKITGYTIKPLYSKNNRQFQNFFVDRRYISSKICSTALESAYQNQIMTGKFPACVINISLPPDNFDVNIHPTKAQVRFSDEKAISDSIYFAIKNALMYSNLIYDFKLPQSQPYRQWRETGVGKNTDFIQPEIITEEEQENPKKVDYTFLEKKNNSRVFTEIESKPTEHFEYDIDKGKIKEEKSEDVRDVEKENSSDDIFDNNIQKDMANEARSNSPVESDLIEKKGQAETAETLEQMEQAEPAEHKKIIVVGEVFKNYIVAQAGDDMYIIDKHAAHERVNFEKLVRGVGKQDQQFLLTPVQMLLSAEEFDALKQNQQRLADAGFILSFDNFPYVSLVAEPMFVARLDGDEILSEIANNILIHRHDIQTHYFDDMLHSIACKASVKENDDNVINELQYLADEIFDDKSIRHCPHGRPIFFKISKYELDKQFKRTGV